MKMLKWIHMNNFWLRESEKKEKQRKVFLVTIGNVLRYLILFLPKLDFYNCQSCKCGQLSHNYIKRDLGNPNFSSITIVLPLFS